MSAILSDQPLVDATVASAGATAKPGIKSMDYHRQMLQNKMKSEESQKFVSPSDNVMSPCTQKLNALRTKQASRMKPRSLFATATSARKLAEGDDMFAPKKSTSS
ncbi:putative spo12-like protein [Ceratocystis lukuohia]|uniref:Spo12-like protein n=2 Tax=Ceratocystis TaxID=5157 RepID=A0A2C5XHL2_9PEZI|nr:hypothetical protein CFIMG_003883RA [Ceratocystis fimbriata CBS 114723]